MKCSHDLRLVSSLETAGHTLRLFRTSVKKGFKDGAADVRPPAVIVYDPPGEPSWHFQMDDIAGAKQVLRHCAGLVEADWIRVIDQHPSCIQRGPFGPMTEWFGGYPALRSQV